MADPENLQGSGLFSEIGKNMEQLTGKPAELFETAIFTVEMRRALREHLEQGLIPLFPRVDEANGTAILEPMVSEAVIRGVFAEMGVPQEVIDERIANFKETTGFYSE